MNRVFLLLGSNIENRMQYLERATVEIESEVGRIIQKSSVYESEPWGFSDEIPFLNQVLIVQTALEPDLLLKRLQTIEGKLDRVRKSTGYEARTIDIDILFYGNKTLKKQNLTIPHPLLHKRKFTLLPLAEVAGDFIHPVLNKSVVTLAENCSDNLQVNFFQKA